MINDQRGSARRDLSILFNVGTVSDLPDAELVRRFVEAVGESGERAFAALVGRHGPMVLATCRSILRDSHTAQDAFQATFMVLARRAGSLRVQSSLGPWLHEVAYRTACCSLAATERRRRHERKAAALAAPIARQEVRDDLGPALHREIQRLPERYRPVVLLCCMEGLTIGQAAHQLGWPTGTVQSRLARGRERLRARLLRLGLAPSGSLVATALMPEPARAAAAAASADFLARAAKPVAAGQILTTGAISASAPVIALMKGALHSMFVTRIQRAAAVAVSIGALAAGAAGLAQVAGHQGGTTPDPAATGATFKFEIRTWKDGQESGRPVVVEVTGGTSYNVETPDAVIQIRPRLRKEGPDRRVKRLEDAEHLSRLRQRASEEERDLAVAMETNPSSETELRLGRLEQKIEEILKALRDRPR